MVLNTERVGQCGDIGSLRQSTTLKAWNGSGLWSAC